MKKSSRFLSFAAAALSLLMAFSLSACDFGSSGGKNSESQGENTASQGATSQSGAGVQSDNSASQGGNSSQSGADGQPTVVDNGNLISYAAVSEGLYCVWKETSVKSAKAYYKQSGTSDYTQVDSQLIRQTETGKARVDMPGLAAGKYDVKIDVGSSDKDIVIENIGVTAYDRSGYAHYNYGLGVGAYKNDGTLKSGAIVVYVDESNKNTVTANGKTGIAAIIKSATNKPVVIRIIGQVASDTKVNATTYEGKFEKINGLSEKANTGDGTLWGQLNAEGIRNFTLEGVGDDAKIYQWGITFKRCNSIEVRNLTFADYPEDACAFDGGSNEEAANYGNYWVHNNVFNIGKRLFDDSDDQDKKEGDGAIDIKYCHDATYSYNKIVSCHKTGLVGGSDGNLQWNLTYHHNWFYKCQSRMPLGRQANMHYYNNYYDSTTSYCMSLRGNAYVFSEANYFYNCKKTVEVKSGACKSYNDVFSGCTKNDATVVTDRTKTVNNSCSYGPTFDTDASKFYYDASNKATKVTYLTSADQAKTDCQNLAGPCKANKNG